MELEKLRDIFRYAQVIDVDFSLWDERCRFLVIAIESDGSTGPRLPVYFVDFLGADAIEFKFGHWKKRPQRGHYQWIIDEIEVSSQRDRVAVKLSSSPEFPITEFVCADVRITPADITTLDRLFPGWDRPGASLVRPGVEQLAKLLLTDG